MLGTEVPLPGRAGTGSPVGPRTADGTGGDRRPALPASTDRTPATWRVAAAGLLVGGLVAGDRIAGAAVLRTAVSAVAAGVLPWATVVRQARVAKRRDQARAARAIGAPDAAGLPSVDVVIPARDEAAALPALLQDLGQQDHRDPSGRPRFAVIVVDDRSTDGTGSVALAAAEGAGLAACTSIARRAPGATPDGKGAALAAVPRSSLQGMAIVVLDADARIAPDFLRRAAARVAAGDPAFTARRRVRHADASPLAAAQAVEQAIDGLQLRARAAAGGFGELRGNGMVVTPAALEAAGGWPAGTLTEDLDLSTRLAACGIRVAWAGDLTAWEAPTATVAALWLQRLRWADGSARRFLALLPSALGSLRLPLSAKVDLAAYAGQLVLPPVLVGAAIGGLRRRRPMVPLVFAGTWLGAAVGLAWVAVGEDAVADGLHLAPRGRLVRALLGGAFTAHWLAVVPVALARIAVQTGPTKYVRTRARIL